MVSKLDDGAAELITDAYALACLALESAQDVQLRADIEEAVFVLAYAVETALRGGDRGHEE